MPRKPGSKPSKPFTKGDPRINRKGRPKVGLTFAEWVRDAMESPDETTGRRKVDDLIAEAMRRALRGNFQFWDALIARGYGKVPDKVQIDPEQKPDLSKLTSAELAEWMRLLKKAQ